MLVDDDSNNQSQLEDLSIKKNTFSSRYIMLNDDSDLSSNSQSQSNNEKSDTIKVEKSSTPGKPSCCVYCYMHFKNKTSIIQELLIDYLFQ